MAAICPLCGAGTTVIHQDRRRRFVHCAACDLISVPRACHLAPELQRERYTRHHNSPEDAGYVAMLNRPIALLQQFAADARRVLDYGSGPAPVLVELLRRAGYEAAGYDPFFAGDADLSPPFDAVVSIETFEHFAEPGRELENIRRLLRPGGCLVVMTLFHPDPAGLEDWWYARDATHVAFYSPRTLDWIAGRFGFDLLYCDNERLAALRTSTGRED
jgi:SAM-dependent methyltransferase